MTFFLAALAINAVICISFGLQDALTIFTVCFASTLVMSALL